jgi:hypothetical protein
MLHVHRYYLQAAATLRWFEREKAGSVARLPAATAREEVGVLLRLGAVMVLAVGAVSAVLAFAARTSEVLRLDPV